MDSKNRYNAGLYQFPKRIIQFFIILFLIILLGLPALHLYFQYRTRSQIKITSSTGIDTLIAVKFDGFNNWLKIRSWNRNNPIILFIHGGPGAPLFPNIREIGHSTGLEKNFVVVYWEQPGTGKSFNKNIPDSIMTIEKFVSYTIKLSQYLKAKFPNDKLYLMARSWGSLIGILTVKKNPDLFNGYIGIDQLVYALKNDSISYQYTLELARKYNNQEALEELRKIGYPPYSSRQVIIQRRWLTKFYRQFMGDEFNIERQNQFIKLLSTPEYSIVDIIRMGQEPFFSIEHLWNG
ncbi:MAG: alpha/beta hydrolase, partial [Candidatus Marinimicrobia bacterium]|nr:alpha/beta hydrolase [Candidatus Neomarinimicrobiota bacterium]